MNSEPKLVLFRTCGAYDPSAHVWGLPIHAWAYDPTRSSRMQKAALALFRRYIRYKTKTPPSAILDERTEIFGVGNRRGLSLQLQLGNREYHLDKTGSNGHISGAIRIPEADLLEAWGAGSPGGRWLNLTAAIKGAKSSPIQGRILCVPRAGVSIISDIDDTIKQSHVRNRGELLANTFLRDFQSVPQVAEVYQRWATAGVAFHYVSSSPWQLHERIVQFLAEQDFPEGSLHLRHIRLRDSRLLGPFALRREGKAASLHRVLLQHPQRKFILIGDSGEKDPEIYGTAARKFPQQILRILIRDVTGHSTHAKRYRAAFEKLPSDLWRLYHDATELHAEWDTIANWVQ